MSPVRRSAYERVMARTEWSGGCLIFTGPRLPKGYGRVGAGGRGGRILLAHRVVWERHHGPIPIGLVVRHLICDNPPCVLIDHLALGTHKDNNYDMWRQGKNLIHSPLKEECVNGHKIEPGSTNAAGCRACQRDRKRRQPTYLYGGTP